MTFNSYIIAESLIEDIFLIHYCPTIIESRTWYDNINEFLLEELDHIQLIQQYEYIPKQFTPTQEAAILQDALIILLQTLGIDLCEWETHEEDVSWYLFDDIVTYYMRMYKPKKKDNSTMISHAPYRMAAGGG